MMLRPLSLWIVWLALTELAGAAPAAPPEPARPAPELVVHVLHTSDLHGQLLPWNYLTDQETPPGLARVATYVDSIRRAETHVLLLDGGDTIQGNPLAYFFVRLAADRPNPIIAAMNWMGYDAMTIGNHEFDFGLATLESVRRQARFPLLSANTLAAGTSDPYFEPYVIRQFGEVRVGVIGLTTPHFAKWDPPDHFRSLTFSDTVAAAHRWVRELRERHAVHAVIINAHQGFELDPSTGGPLRSVSDSHAWRIIRDVPGVDVLLTGHSHQVIEPRQIDGRLVSQPGNWGSHVTHLRLTFRRESAGWILTGKGGRNVEMGPATPPHPGLVDLLGPAHDEVRQWVNEPLAEAAGVFDSDGVWTRDNAVLDLIHRVMRERTGAEMSLTAFHPRSRVTFGPGPIRPRDMFAIYRHENSLVTLAMTGQAIRDTLEHAARFYDRVSGRPDQPGGLALRAGDTLRAYNFDTLSGAEYAIDPTRPVGQRVVYLERDGLPLDPEREYTVAVNSFRASGGGEYEPVRQARVVTVDPADIRTLLIEYVQRQGTVYPLCDRNWHLQFPARVVFPPTRR